MKTFCILKSLFRKIHKLRYQEELSFYLKHIKMKYVLQFYFNIYHIILNTNNDLNFLEYNKSSDILRFVHLNWERHKANLSFPYTCYL